MSAWLTATVAGLVAYLLRAAVPVLAGDRELPEPVVRGSRLAAPAVIAALLAGSLATTPALPSLLPRLAVVGVGLAVAARTRSVPWTIAAGIVTHLVVEVMW